MGMNYAEFMQMMDHDLTSMDREGNTQIELREGRHSRVIVGRYACAYFAQHGENSAHVALYRLKAGELVIQAGWFNAKRKTSRLTCLDFHDLPALRAWLSDDTPVKRLTSAQRVCLRDAKRQLAERLQQGIGGVLDGDCRVLSQ